MVDRAFDDYVFGWTIPYARAAGAELAVLANLPDAAARLTTAAEAVDHNQWVAACLTRANGHLANDQLSYLSALNSWTQLGARTESALTRRFVI